MTTVLVLVILGLIWAAVLVPPYLQNRREHRPGDSIASFRHQLAVIERATPEGRARFSTRADVARFDAPRYAPAQVAYAPRQGRPKPSTARRDPRAEVRKRRRDVFVTLLGAAAVTFLLALVMGGTVWMLHFVIDAALVGYVGLLLKFQQMASDRELKVRFLEQAPMRGQLRSVPTYAGPQQPLLRRVGS